MYTCMYRKGHRSKPFYPSVHNKIADKWMSIPSSLVSIIFHKNYKSYGKLMQTLLRAASRPVHAGHNHSKAQFCMAPQKHV